MGVYLNPGNDMFCETVRGEIYVDKTELIRETNRRLKTSQKFVCISRPRRFGKSMAAYMLAAYYGKDCDSSEQFAPYKIAKCDSYEKYLNQYNVIMLNIQDFLSMTSSVEEMLSCLQSEVIRELCEVYPDVVSKDERILSMALNRLYGKKKEAFVFIIDGIWCWFRYGCVFNQYTEGGFYKYRGYHRKKFLHIEIITVR